MEVLSALLGLDIYTRMEEIAKGKASEQRRLIAATKERISILGEKISAREQLKEDDRIIAEKAAALSDNIGLTETALKTAEQDWQKSPQPPNERPQRCRKQGNSWKPLPRTKQGSAALSKRGNPSASPLSGVKGNSKKSARTKPHIP